MFRQFTVAVVVLVALCGESWGGECREVEGMASEALVSFLRTNASNADPQCVTDAIWQLGESKSASRAAIDVLISLLDFRRPQTNPERMHISINRDWFPAVSALFSIGKPAVTPLIATLKSGQMSETARQNGIRAILAIYRDDPPQAVVALKNAAAAAHSEAEAVTLEQCAKDAVSRCSKSWKDRCEAALR
jgi:hypothetical protein